MSQQKSFLINQHHLLEWHFSKVQTFTCTYMQIDTWWVHIFDLIYIEFEVHWSFLSVNPSSEFWPILTANCTFSTSVSWPPEGESRTNTDPLDASKSHVACKAQNGFVRLRCGFFHVALFQRAFKASRVEKHWLNSFGGAILKKKSLKLRLHMLPSSYSHNLADHCNIWCC